MKRIICAVLVCVLALSFVACGKKDDPKAEAPKGLQIGYSKVDITPSEFGLPMGGYGNTASRLSNGLLSYIYITTLAATGENGETILLCGVDAMNMPGDTAKAARTAMAEATGVPFDNIYLSASHSHSTPYMDGDYLEFFVECAADSAKAAMADRTNATMEGTTGNGDGLTWVRHVILQNGSYAGPNFGDWSSPVKEHATEADTEFRVVRFVRPAKDKKDVVMVNWQVHPTMTGDLKKYDISADLVGEVRDYVSENLDVECMYLQGASGNLAPTSFVPGETVTSDYREYGMLLGEKVVAAVQAGMTPIGGTDVKVAKTSVTGYCDHTEDHLVEKAKEIQEAFASNGNNKEVCRAMGMPYGIEGIYHANSIVTRSKRGESQQVPADAASIGDLGLAIAPYEMTDTNGMQIREASPFDMTFIVGYTNGYYNYIIADGQYDYANYEYQTRRYTRGIGEDMAEAFIGMLEDIHG